MMMLNLSSQAIVVMENPPESPVLLLITTWMLQEEHLLAADQPSCGKNRENRLWRRHTEEMFLVRIMIQIFGK